MAVTDIAEVAAAVMGTQTGILPEVATEALQTVTARGVRMEAPTVVEATKCLTWALA